MCPILLNQIRQDIASAFTKRFLEVPYCNSRSPQRQNDALPQNPSHRSDTALTANIGGGNI
jgi:hypothetical protein